MKLDLDFQKLAIATTRSTGDASGQPWSSATIDINGLNYIDLQARISAAELDIGDARFTPAAIDATLTTGVLKAQVSNLGAYEGSANGDLTVDVSTPNPTYAMRADLTGVRALPLLDGLADFDKATRDPADPEQLLPAFDSGDHLHPNDAGARALAETALSALPTMLAS